VRWVALILLCACARNGVQDLPDASAEEGGVLDTGIDNSGPLLGELSIMTWNIEQFPKTATTTSLVHEIILSLQPDLIGVQEISEPLEYERFIDRLPGYGGYYVYTHDFIRVGFLYREDRVTLANIEALFTEDSYNFPRSPLKADVTITSTAGELFDFVFMVVHHKAQSDVESRERRRAANVHIDNWIRARMMESDEQDFVVVGDYNDRLEDRPGENVFEVFLEQPELYFFLTGSLAMEGETSYIPIPGLIDHVLITTDALYEYGDGTTEVLRLDSTVQGYRNFISDHRPVMARFKVHQR
jgi:exonuclease III